MSENIFTVYNAENLYIICGQTGEAEIMTWSDYIITVAAPHSRYNAQLWFRYLRKDINKNISKKQIDELYNSKALSAFQRVSLKAAFTEGSPTREHILSLNNKVVPNKLSILKEKYGNKL